VRNLLLTLACGVCGIIAGVGLPAKGQSNWMLFVVGIGLAGATIYAAARRRPERSWASRYDGIGLFIILLVVTIIVNPVFISAQAVSTNATCMSHLKQLGNELIIYSCDFDDHLPPRDHWLSRIYNKGSTICPASKAPYSYALNERLAGKSLAELEIPGETVMVFECESQVPDPVGDKTKFAAPHGGLGFIALANGAVVNEKKSEVKYNWTPTLISPAIDQ